MPKEIANTAAKVSKLASMLGFEVKTKPETNFLDTGETMTRSKVPVGRILPPSFMKLHAQDMCGTASRARVTWVIKSDCPVR